MSVPNGEKLATKQDLADMYQGILPYLGGMPEMLANKFSKGDLYSTDEKMIGQWIDGKPLYQKTITLTNVAISTTQANVGDISSLNIDSGVVTQVEGYKSDGNVYAGLGYFACWIRKGDNNLGIRATFNTTGTFNTINVTLQYTKTTDSAISIGSDTDYSTEEKIVGTWIDGKPVYQKTVVMTMPTATSQKDGAYWRGDTSVDVTSLNISQLVNLSAMSSYPQICNLMPYLGYSGEMEGTQYAKMNAIMCWCDKSTISIRRFMPSSVNPDAGADVYVTLQYTKTT